MLCPNSLLPRSFVQPREPFPGSHRPETKKEIAERSPLSLEPCLLRARAVITCLTGDGCNEHPLV